MTGVDMWQVAMKRAEKAATKRGRRYRVVARRSHADGGWLYQVRPTNAPAAAPCGYALGNRGRGAGWDLSRQDVS